MTELASNSEEVKHWHRRFAVECNNLTWDIASQPDRSASEEENMVFAAHAAAYHWKLAGQALQHARADATLAHALSLAGKGEDALHYARRCLAYFEANPAEDWDLAFAHLEVALAAAVRKDSALHARHFARAKELGTAIAEEDDRSVFLDELGRIPDQV
jgi:hypothetical protein